MFCTGLKATTLVNSIKNNCLNSKELKLGMRRSIARSQAPSSSTRWVGFCVMTLPASFYSAAIAKAMKPIWNA
jgi:hypothetical protein